MYSLQIRKKIIGIKEKEGLSYVKVAKRFGMSPTTVFKWSKTMKPKKGRRKPATKIDMKALKKDVKENPELYQYERAEKFRVSKSSIGYALKRLGVSYKKNIKASKSGREKAYYLQRKSGEIRGRRAFDSLYRREWICT